MKHTCTDDYSYP